MPYNEPDPTDPLSLVGVEVSADEEALLEMAYVISEEYAQLGYDENRLLRIFRNPYFRSAFQAHQMLGEERIRKVVREALQLWGRVRFVDRSPGPVLVQLEIADSEK